MLGMDMGRVRRVGDGDVVLLGELGGGVGDEVELLSLFRMGSRQRLD